MASNNVEDGNPKDSDENEDDGACVVDHQNIEKTESISLKAEEYLNTDDVRFCSDPKLKRERQKLQDLLNSYKKLIGKLDRRFNTEEERIAEEKRLSKVPEIYAILHPELYRNSREDEKTRLIEKFSKRQFSPVDRVIPPICRTPDINIHDKRQEEKERLIKILASCPARFHNLVDSAAIPVKVRRPKYSAPVSCPKNDRDLEKERLCKILATSGAYYRKSLDKRSNPLLLRKPKQEQLSRSTFDCNQKPSSKRIMVRTGDYQSLKEASNFLQGSGEHNERRAQILSERRREYQEHLDSSLRNGSHKADKSPHTNNFYQKLDEVDVDVDDETRRRRCNSTSTQTEPLEETHRNPLEEITKSQIEETIKNTPKENGVKSAPYVNYENNEKKTENEMFYLSPRDKLMSDLHGISNCFPGGSKKLLVSPREEHQDLRVRQAAYAKALEEQIKEKRRLEEEKKLKEREEDELIEHRIQLQQKKFESEVNEEEKRRHDWMAQRQCREEVLRRRMLELELEAQELKKSERKKKHDVGQLTPEPKRDSIGSRSRPLPPPQTTHSEPSYSFARPIISNGPPRGSKFEGLRAAPLLDADRQNILPSRNGLALASPRFEFQPSYIKPESVRKTEEIERAEELLKAPLDFRIDRPPSPPIPAVKTRGIMNNNVKVLESKWEVPKNGEELKRTQAGRDNILTQLGTFRRQLHQEHVKLEARLLKQQTP